MATEKVDLILWSELAPPLGVVGCPPQFQVKELTDCIDALLTEKYQGYETVPVSAITDALGIPVEGVTWDSLMLYLKDLARQAAQAAAGETPTSPSFTRRLIRGRNRIHFATGWHLTPRPGRRIRSAGKRQQGKHPRRNERLHNLAHPGNERDKDSQARMKLIGLNASFEARRSYLWGMPRTNVKGLRDRLLISLCALGAQQGHAARRDYNSLTFSLNCLSDAQITALSVATLARVRRGGVRVVSLRASAHAKPGALPQRMRVLDWGMNRTLKGDLTVDETTLAVFAANQRKTGRDRVALDFEHNTVPGSEEYNRSQEPRSVAGFWTPQVIRGEGLVLVAPTWTPEGQKSALNYEDVSAAVFAFRRTHPRGRF
ncbi:MAG TPA: hypothetical protein VGF13_18905 [Verrucomicrobiae bacterium]|jgi:hypothetical protein